ncbi:MAG: AAA family ATPase [Thiohalocapsa sp.]
MNPSSANASARTQPQPQPWRRLGCLEDPFRVCFDQRFVYLGHDQEQGFQRLVRRVRAGECVSLVTGGAGTGKTTLLSQLAADLNASSPLVLFFATPPQSLASLLQVGLRVGLQDCPEQSGGPFASGSGTADPAVQLRAFLSGIDSQAIPLLLIDEAQSLGDELLGDMLALAAPGAGGQRLLRMVLAGDPSLAGRLREAPFGGPPFPLGYHYRVPALSKPKVSAFIRHRLSAAGCEDCAPFADEAVERIAGYANGVVGTVNTLCRLALFFSAKDGETRVSASSVDRGASTALLSQAGPKVSYASTQVSAPQTKTALGPEPSRHNADRLHADSTDAKSAAPAETAPRPANRSNALQASVGPTTTPGTSAGVRDPELSNGGIDSGHGRSRSRRWIRLAAAMSVLAATASLLAFHVSSLNHRPQGRVAKPEAGVLSEAPVPMDRVTEETGPLDGREPAGSSSGQGETPAQVTTTGVSLAPSEAAEAPANDVRNQEKVLSVASALQLETLVVEDAEIDRMLAQAQAHFDADRLVAPRFDNAFAVYRQILRANPGNSSALNGVAAIRSRLLDYARVESDLGDAVNARSHLQKIRAIDEQLGQMGHEVSEPKGDSRDTGLRLSPPRNLRPTVSSGNSR